VWKKNEGAKIKVAILDTGIDLGHPDLRKNIKGNVNIIKPGKSAKDDNGHGTHIAGVIAAVNNDIGVIGTGPKIHLYAVKILDKKGRGWLSDLIEGLDWCIDNEMQVVNMCFGSYYDNQSFHDAIIEAYQAGISLVASAGNNGEYDGFVEYPAKYAETIAVSAVDRYGNFASFSSFGPEIDLTAPGVDIRSTYKKGSYEIMSGTSMSAPHVTGVVALILKTKVKYYDFDGDKRWDPYEIRVKLKVTAEALGLVRNKQGAGLVRANFAVR
jgi:subtilisin family serine protease